MSEKSKKPKKTVFGVLIRAADLLRAAKYNTKTESSYKEYAEIEFEVRKIINSFKDTKEPQQEAKDTIKHEPQLVKA